MEGCKTPSYQIKNPDHELRLWLRQLVCHLLAELDVVVTAEHLRTEVWDGPGHAGLRHAQVLVVQLAVGVVRVVRVAVVVLAGAEAVLKWNRSSIAIIYLLKCVLW